MSSPLLIARHPAGGTGVHVLDRHRLSQRTSRPKEMEAAPDLLWLGGVSRGTLETQKGSNPLGNGVGVETKKGALKVLRRLVSRVK